MHYCPILILIDYMRAQVWQIDCKSGQDETSDGMNGKYRADLQLIHYIRYHTVDGRKKVV